MKRRRPSPKQRRQKKSGRTELASDGYFYAPYRPWRQPRKLRASYTLDVDSFAAGDRITIMDDNFSNNAQPKKVHVARRRTAIKKNKPEGWKIVNTSGTTMTVTRGH